MITPCFYCNKEAKYTGNVDKVNDTYNVVDVCEDHFVSIESSSWLNSEALYTGNISLMEH